MGADFLCFLVNEVAQVPVTRGAGEVYEIFQDFLAFERVFDLRVELDSVKIARGIANDGVGVVFGGGENAEALGEGGYAVAVGHPDLGLRRDAREESGRVGYCDLSFAVFRAFTCAALNGAAEHLGH